MPTKQTPASELGVFRTERGAEVFHGVPCRACKGTLKYVSTRNCVKCAKASAARQGERRRQARAAAGGV